MATPRVTIDQLPPQTTLEDTNQIIIQDSGVTKRMAMSVLTGATSVPLAAHIADTTDAHAATAISATPSGSGVDGANVQIQLGQLVSLIGTGGGGGGGGITPEDAVDAVAAALVEGAGIDIAYDDPGGTITITATGGGGGGLDAEGAVDAVAAALVGGTNINITYNDALNTITITSTVPAGPQGDPGPAGGALLAAFWTYNTTVTAPPAAGQIRTNSPITTLWIHETDADGFVRASGLTQLTSGNKILVRAANGTSADWEITGPPVDNGVYWTIPITEISGSVTKGARTQLNFILDQGGVPPGGTVGQVLAKASSIDFDTEWVAPGGGGGGITTEDAVDAVAGALVEGAAIDITYNDAANTITVATLPFSAALPGAVPASGGGTANFLRADGTWAPSTTTNASGNYNYSYSATTTAPPSDTQIRFNNATLASATQAWIDYNTVEGQDIRNAMLLMSVGERIYMQVQDDATRWMVFTLSATPTDAAGYVQFSGTRTAGSATPPSAGAVTVSFLSASSASFQPADSDLTAVAGLSTNGLINRTGTGVMSTVAVPVPVASGGTGLATLTGLAKGNGTSAFTAATPGTDYYAPGGADVAVADGGTGASTAAAARTNLVVPEALNGVTGVWAGTQAAYDAITPKVATVLYFITA